MDGPSFHENTSVILQDGSSLTIKDLKIGQSVRAFSMSQHTDGHLRVHGWKDNKAQHQWVSRMLWENINGNIPENMIVHHIDENKLNNTIENLELFLPPLIIVKLLFVQIHNLINCGFDCNLKKVIYIMPRLLFIRLLCLINMLFPGSKQMNGLCFDLKLYC